MLVTSSKTNTWQRTKTLVLRMLLSSVCYNPIHTAHARDARPVSNLVHHLLAGALSMTVKCYGTLPVCLFVTTLHGTCEAFTTSAPLPLWSSVLLSKRTHGRQYPPFSRRLYINHLYFQVLSYETLLVETWNFHLKWNGYSTSHCHSKNSFV